MGWGGDSSELQQENKLAAHTDTATEPGPAAWVGAALTQIQAPSTPTCPFSAPPPAGAEAAPSPLRLQSLLTPLGMSLQSGVLSSPLNLALPMIERVPLSGHPYMCSSGHQVIHVLCARPSSPRPSSPLPPSRTPAPCTSPAAAPPFCCLPVFLTPLYPPVPTTGPLDEALSPSPASQSGFCLHHSTKGSVKG